MPDQVPAGKSADQPDEAGLGEAVKLQAAQSGAPTPAEWAEMRTRVIALETLVVALLATATDAQRALAQDMAGLITPRPGATPHHLTVHAAHRMSDLIERAKRHETARG